MSEHMRIEGKIIYEHASFGDKDEISYCPQCKDTADFTTIGIHQGIEGYWIEFICGKCKKQLWTAGLFDEENFSGWGNTRKTAKQWMKEFEERLLIKKK